MKKCLVCRLVVLLAGIGALNWGFVGIAHRDLVAALAGVGTPTTRAVYCLVGLAGLLLLVQLVVKCPCCKDGSCSTKK